MDTNIKPQISVIMITRNRAHFIAAAIESVLRQSFSDWELLILDDDSTDGTDEIVKRFADADKRIQYVKNNSVRGISASRNDGLEKAQGEYIAVLDSDDVWTDMGKLQKQFDFLTNNPDYTLIGSNIKIVNEKGSFIKNTDFTTEDIDIRAKILIFNQIAHSTVLYRKDTAEKIGGYDKGLSCVEDLDLFLRLGSIGKMKNLKEITTAYTKHSGGVSYKRRFSMAWNNYKIVWKNFGTYPNWLLGMSIAKLRIIKSLF